MSQDIDEAVKAYVEKQFEYEQFLAGVLVFFQRHPQLNKTPLPIIHSIKSRLKDPSHLAEKLQRKLNAGRTITKDNIFSEITDFIGVRVLHLYQDQFPEINSAINKKIEN
jgi:putative GTP pyrophosphokinase